MKFINSVHIFLMMWELPPDPLTVNSGETRPHTSVGFKILKYPDRALIEWENDDNILDWQLDND